MGTLLRQAATQGILADQAVTADYVNRLIGALQGGAVDEEMVQLLVEPISRREMDVLRLLDTHMSSTEIADTLVLSVNTVRSHIKSIYSKLNVHKRGDAVRRARELGLL